MPIQLDRPLAMHVTRSDGTPFDLADYRGTSAVFVYFMRALTCPQCNTAVRILSTRQQELRNRDVEVVVAVPEDAAAAEAWRIRRAVPFPVVVVGQDGTPHADAGILTKVFGAIQQSGGILLDRNGIIRYAHVATNPGHGLDTTALDTAVTELSTARA